MTSDGSKIRCCKEQYCIGTWNVRSVNQGPLEVVKQEMARVNINVLGISELRWTGMGEFNSDDHYIYHCGQESLRRNAVAILVNKRVQNAVLGCNLKNDRKISAQNIKSFQIVFWIWSRNWTQVNLKDEQWNRRAIDWGECKIQAHQSTVSEHFCRRHSEILCVRRFS